MKQKQVNIKQTCYGQKLLINCVAVPLLIQ